MGEARRRVRAVARSLHRRARRSRFGRARVGNAARTARRRDDRRHRESASGRNLAARPPRAALRRGPRVRRGRDDPLARARAGEPALLIGDSAIDATSSVSRRTRVRSRDALARVDGRQTVFAVWAARREAYERDPDGVRACMHALTDAYTWSRRTWNACRARAARHPRAGRVSTNAITVSSISRFIPPRRAGLRRYCRELVALGAIASRSARHSRRSSVSSLASLLGKRAAGGGRLTFDEGVRVVSRSAISTSSARPRTRGACSSIRRTTSPT